MTVTNTTEKKGDAFVQQLESKIQERLEKWHRYTATAYEQYQYYHVIIQDTLTKMWQHDEFRLGVYIFGALSFIPLLLFLGFMSLVILFTTVLTVFLWALITFTLLSVSCILLIPILFGLLLITGFILVAYSLYQYLIRLKQQPKLKQ